MSLYRSMRQLRLLAACVSFAIAVLAGTEAFAGSRDALWELIGSCLDTTALEYCSECPIPRVEKGCAGFAGCEATLEVWAESNNYVALRDRKMCGCPQGYVHGLVIPRAQVSGVEDPLRPSGIWPFAWEVARKRMGDDPAAALVVNPRFGRSQDQLHVHIVRLKKDARQRLAKRPQTRVQCLDQVWSAAGDAALAEGIDDYGVLVASDPKGGYVVVIDAENPEKKYTDAKCH